MAKTKQKKKKIDLKVEKVPYFHDAKVSCSCGAKFEVGSTLKEINVEVCSRCHPFYTGTQKLVDTSGRVDKFKSRLEKQAKMIKKNVKLENKNTDIDKKDQEKVMPTKSSDSSKQNKNTDEKSVGKQGDK